MATAATAQLSKTREQLRVLIADELGDYRALTFTATGNAGKTTAIDTERLTTATETLLGATLLFTGPTNNDGLERVITNFAGSTGTLTFAAVTTQTATSDTAEVYNRRGTGWLPAEYNRAINAVIEEASGFGLLDLIDAAGTFDADVPEITVDASLMWVYAVEWQDSDDFWHRVPYARDHSKHGWEPDPATGQIRILGQPARWADGNTIQIRGYGRQDTMATDAATCLLNAAWVVAATCVKLLWQKLDRDPQTYGQKIVRYEEKANSLRRRMQVRQHPDARPVRSI